MAIYVQAEVIVAHRAGADGYRLHLVEVRGVGPWSGGVGGGRRLRRLANRCWHKVPGIRQWPIAGSAEATAQPAAQR